jgi:hypothetical protein
VFYRWLCGVSSSCLTYRLISSCIRPFPNTTEKMKKKMSNDFLSKDSFLWINPRSRTLHW